MEKTQTIIPFVVATKNQDKVNEIREILKDLPFEIITMTDAGCDDDI